MVREDMVLALFEVITPFFILELVFSLGLFLLGFFLGQVFGDFPLDIWRVLKWIGSKRRQKEL